VFDGMDDDVDCFGECFGDGFLDIAETCCEFVEADACGLCFGPATSPEDCIPLVTISISDLFNDGAGLFTTTINMENTVPIAGWQFDLTSLPDVINVLGAYGGSSEDADHSVSFNASGTVIAFPVNEKPITVPLALNDTL
jgi:hypothetical protein